MTTQTSAPTSAPTKQRRQKTQKGLTYFFSVGMGTQIALHKSPSGHYSYITYTHGVQLHPSTRTTLGSIARRLHGWNADELQDLFNP